MGVIKSLIILLVGAALATFLWSNYDQGVVIYFTQRFRTVELPLAAALVLSLVTGLLLAVALSLPNQFRMRGKIRELTRRIDRLETENAELRKLPLDDSLPRSSSRAPEPAKSKSEVSGPKTKPSGG